MQPYYVFRYNLQRSYERFEIEQIINHKIPFYILRDEKDRILSGYFNDYELVKIDLEKYRVNVLKKKKVRGRNWVKLSFKVCSTYSVYSIKVFLKGIRTGI